MDLGDRRCSHPSLLGLRNHRLNPSISVSTPVDRSSTTHHHEHWNRVRFDNRIVHSEYNHSETRHSKRTNCVLLFWFAIRPATIMGVGKPDTVQPLQLNLHS